jgi:hypothetical protein
MRTLKFIGGVLIFLAGSLLGWALMTFTLMGIAKLLGQTIGRP